MDQVHIRYTTTAGIEKTERFRTDETEINLDLRDMASVDLLPLIWCQKLRCVSLRNNRLTEVNLLPLGRCVSFENLRLSNNLLEEIDLGPLSDCTHLQVVEMQGNQLKRVDISPLFHCPELCELNIDNSSTITADLLLRSVGSWPRIILDLFHKIQWEMSND